MLRELHIKNIAVIDEVAVEFGGGLNVLTGETGAGKSILIDSINMALGARSSRDLIRSGEEKATVDIMFEIEDAKTCAELEEIGIEAEDGGVFITRTMTSDGRSVCRVNGRPTPLSVVRDAGRLLLNIHGQHDNQALLNPKLHLDFVDSYGGLGETLDEYRAAYRAARETQRELSELTRDEEERERRVDMLKFQLAEIDAAKLKPDEEENLAARVKYLNNVGKIAAAAGEAYEKLYAGEGIQRSAYDLISEALRSVGNASEFDAELAARHGELSEMLINLEETARGLKDSLDKADFDPNEADAAESRLNLIYGLKRKYGADVPEIIARGEEIRAELEKIENSGERAEELKAELEARCAEMEKRAAELSKRRKACGVELARRVCDELRELDMNISFEVGVHDKTDREGNVVYDLNGAEEAEFMIAANPSEPLKFFVFFVLVRLFSMKLTAE